MAAGCVDTAPGGHGAPVTRAAVADAAGVSVPTLRGR